MINQYLQNIFYHFILSDPSLALKMEPDFFDSKNLQICFQYAKDYTVKYHNAPTASQLKELLQIDGKEDLVPSDVIDILYSSAQSVKEYTPEWLYDNDSGGGFNSGPWQSIIVRSWLDEYGTEQILF